MAVRKPVKSAGYYAPFPTKLRALFAQSNRTQADLAKALGLSGQAVSYYCNGKTHPDIYTLPKIAHFFCVSMEFLLDLPKPQTKEQEFLSHMASYAGLRAKAAQSGGIFPPPLPPFRSKGAAHPPPSPQRLPPPLPPLPHLRRGVRNHLQRPIRRIRRLRRVYGNQGRMGS